MGRSLVLSATVLIGILLGIITAINAFGSVGLKAVSGSPHWSEWRLEQSDSMLIYALGHFLSAGQLPPPKSARFFERNVDDEGNGLRADCAYVLQVKLTPSRWWTLSVANAGVLSPHTEITAGEAFIGSDGILKVTISARPSPGNWIVPSVDGSMNLHFIVNEPTASEVLMLPTVTKNGC